MSSIPNRKKRNLELSTEEEYNKYNSKKRIVIDIQFAD
jgi:hypothetical protein